MASPAASKPVSSRLLNMKFMQRPSNNNKRTTAETKETTLISTDTHTTTNIHKDAKKDVTTVGISRAAIQAAKKAEEGRREAAITGSSAGISERWSLGVSGGARGGEMVGAVRVFVGDVSSPSHSSDDDDGDGDDDGGVKSGKEGVEAGGGRRYFGGRTAPAPVEKEEEESSEDEEGRARKVKAAERALRGLTQIGGRAPAQSHKDVMCYLCQKKGHVRAACPSRGEGAAGRDGGSGGNSGKGGKRSWDRGGGDGGTNKKRQRRG
ncbi:hypothetical protein TWF696_003811 [Orbilia brochopaga]|uniref:CCHC-type domain-containing protein n=1 Tax=Orbilia brochopaga TaxID=3140254 RepID=A0AAV9V476_9PEZI